MKICPKCEGRYFDDMHYCSECFGGGVIELSTEEEYKSKTGKGFETLNKINLEREIKDKEYEKKHPIRQRHFQSYSKPKTVEDNIPKCPICGSTNLKKLDALDRGFSVFMLGLGSNKIGKTYQCKNCKSTF